MGLLFQCVSQNGKRPNEWEPPNGLLDKIRTGLETLLCDERSLAISVLVTYEDGTKTEFRCDEKREA